MNVLHELYNGNITEVHRSLPKHKFKEELKLYEELKSKLETNLKELFLKYSDLYGERMDKALEDKYIQGFKIGLLIGIECNKIKF